MTKCQWWCTGD